MASTLAPLTASELHRLGAFIHERHDGPDSFKPSPRPQWNVVIAPDREDLICHHDLAAWNLVWDGIDGCSSTGAVRARARGCGTWPTPRRPSPPCVLAATPSQTGLGCVRWPTGTVLTSKQRGAFPAWSPRTRVGCLTRLGFPDRGAAVGAAVDEGHGEYRRPAADSLEAHVEGWTRPHRRRAVRVGGGFAGHLDDAPASSEHSPRRRAVRGCATRDGWRTDALGSNWVRRWRSESRAARPDGWWVCGNGRPATVTGLLRLAERRPGPPAAVRTASPHAHAVPGSLDRLAEAVESTSRPGATRISSFTLTSCPATAGNLRR
jgi:hypothetical protein